MSAFGLGLHLGWRGSRVRLSVTALALAFAVAFLLAVMGALPARQAKLDRLTARSPLNNRVATAAQLPADAPLTHLESFYSWYRGHTLTGWRVLDARAGQPVPPGMRSLPRPGELVVSPALADVLRGPHRAELASRLPGRVTATLTHAGLSGPDELFAWVGASKASRPDAVQPTRGFGFRAQREPAPPELRIAAQLGALGLLLPVLVLVATATRLSASTRDRRLAAIRLVGGSHRQVAAMAAGEGLLLGLLGTVLGALVFLLLRPIAAGLVPVDGGVFAADLQPPAVQLVAVLVAVPLLSAVASLASMRRLVTNPLEVRRAARARRPLTPWRLVPLAVGLALLGILIVTDRWVGLSVLGGGGLTLVGLALATPVVARGAGALLARGPGLATSLAGRRIAADPSGAGRALIGTVLVVFAGTWLLAFLPLLQQNQGTPERDLRSLLPGSTLLASAAPGFDPVSLRRIEGVRDVLALRPVQLAPPGYTGTQQEPVGAVGPQEAVVGRCADVVRVLGLKAKCADATAHVIQLGDAQAGPAEPVPAQMRLLGSDGLPGRQVILPVARPDLRLPMAAQGINGLYPGSLLLEPSMVPAARDFAQLVVVNDGRPSTVERIRAALPAGSVFGAMTLNEGVAQQDRVVLGYLRAARLGLVLAVLVGSVSLLVTVVDEVSRRRRDLAALVALGVPRRLLRRALLIQAAAPAVACSGMAVVAGAYASVCYLAQPNRDGDGVPLPWTGWAAVTAAALIAVLAVTALTLPLTRSSLRPEHLRAS